MKKIYLTLVIALMAVGVSAQNIQVQGRGFMGADPCMLEPKLTNEQQESIKRFRTELQKELLQINNLLNEKRAQLRTLEQTDKPDTKAINSKIDEITNLQNKKMKAVSANRAKIRSILSEEQRLEFDLRMKNRQKLGRNHGKMVNEPKVMQLRMRSVKTN